MFLFYFPLWCYLFTGFVDCQYYFVIAPNVIRYEHDETVTVSVFGLNNAAVRVWLEYDGAVFSEKQVVVPDEAHPVTTTIRVREADIFGKKVAEDKPRTLKIFSERAGSRHSRDVILSYQSGYLILQTDKPIYTPMQKVQIRTLALTESLKPSKKQELAMEIISPTNLTMARITIAESQSGFYTNEFTLPPYPDLGVWTARAFYKGQFETSARSSFQVEEYVLPTFGVTIAVNKPYILVDTEDITVTVRAKYVYGKPVDGTARLTLNLKHKDGTTEYILDMNPAELLDDGTADGSVKEFNIDTEKILKSPLLKARDFPDGSRLEVIAKVYERATGKEEARSHDNTMFAVMPFNFHFTRSKVNFRPGWEYYLKVDVTYANGEPAENYDMRIRCFKNGQLKDTRVVKTDSKGQLVTTYGTMVEDNSLTFRAETLDDKQQSREFVVKQYGGKNQIQVETVIDGGVMKMRSFSNIGAGGYTGMLFMVVSRGKVEYTLFENAVNMKSAAIPEDVQKRISPTARLIVFYVDKSNHELVADSVKFYVDEVCRGDELSLKTALSTLAPGKSDQLTVSGSKFMWVGLNVMDKALLLLNDKNVLRKSKMFEALKSHDLGCGEGSGKSSGDVFKKTGLTILTDAVVSGTDLQRNSDTCDNMKRKKRNAEDCYGADPMCCKQGYELSDKLFAETDEVEKLDPYTKCYAKARELALKRTLPTKCIMAFFLTCKIDLEQLITDVTKIISKSLDDDEDYASDLARLAAEGVKPVTRSDFRESWLFKVTQLDANGVAKEFVSYPHSITEWRYQAIGITEDQGMCIAEPLDVKAYRDFFIQLDLPYKATRLESLDVKATIFNYGLPKDPKKTANVYIEGVEHLCLSSEPNKPSPRTQVELSPNSATTVTFPVVPLKNGLFPITVTAMVTDVGIPLVDIVEKKLYVVNEGIEEKISIQVCLDPNQEQKDCQHHKRVKGDNPNPGTIMERILMVDLTLPQNSIAGTGAATGYIQSNIMDNVVMTLLNGIENLFREPSGCGEQTMITLAPTVYAMNYLTQTKQITNDIEVKGNQWVRNGVNREVSQYRHPDGAYAAWQNRPASTWLTAFVAKVFCQAKKVVDDAVDEANDLVLTLNWLKDHVGVDGSFVDNMPVIHREMIGQVNERDPSLTSFVLVTLLECPVRNPGLEEVITRSRVFVENQNRNILRSNPYILALSTYALALADSPVKWVFKDLLESVAHSDNRQMYWGNPGGFPASASSIETTGYALLAMLKFNDLAKSAKIVTWMTSQRDAQGSFRTTQDTVVGLQALSEYSVRTYSPDVNLNIELVGKGYNGEQFSITKENAIVQRIAKNLPVEVGDNTLTVRVKGTGSARMMIDLRYNRPAEDDEVCPFQITDVEVEGTEDRPRDKNIDQIRNCDVCGKCDEPDDVPEYVDMAFGNPLEVVPKIQSNFGRKKRAGGRPVRATATKTCVRFRVRSKTAKNFGMSIVNFGLETGVEVIKEDLDKLQEDNPSIARYELPSDGNGFVVFYLDNITAAETKFVFRLKDNYEGNKNTRQPSYIKVYDYYNPDQRCTQIYGTGPNRGGAVSYQCDKDNKVCLCSRSICAQPVEGEIKALADRGEKPAIKLLRYTCNSEKADYSVLVRIDGVNYDPLKGEMLARGVVLESIHKGIEQLEVNDEMAFFWKQRCTQVELQKGKTYYIIGKDGHRFEAQNGLRYEVMGTALVIEDSVDRLVKSIMTAYSRLMAARGCAD